MTSLARNLGPLFAGLFLGLPALAEELATPADLAGIEVDVIFLGEVHDNPTHHINQAAMIAAIEPQALVFEMFDESAAEAAMSVPRADADRLAQVLDWDMSGWPDFNIYHPIFIAAQDAALFGGAIPRGEVRRAVTEGAAAVFGAAAPLFGLDAALDTEEQATREAGQLAAHCDALPEDVLPGMVEAQRLRDAGLARAVIAALAETGGPVAVITGNGHARTDWAVPRMLLSADPGLRILSIAQFEIEAPENPPFDRWIVTEGAEREDPCLAFRRD